MGCIRQALLHTSNTSFTMLRSRDADPEVQTNTFVSGQFSKKSRTVQQYVTGESASADYGYSSVGPMADELKEPEAPIHTTEPSLTDKTDLAEHLQRGEVKARSPVEQRRFSVDWDPIQ